MAEPRDTQLSSNSLDPLGIKNPLLPAQPLGQNFLSPKFIVPLGARSLTVLDPSIFFSEAIPNTNFLDFSVEDSPFLTRSHSSQTAQITQTTSATPNTTNPAVVQRFLEPEAEVIEQQENTVEAEQFPMQNAERFESTREQKELPPAAQPPLNSTISAPQKGVTDASEPTKTPSVTQSATNVPLQPEQPSVDISSTPNIVQADLETESSAAITPTVSEVPATEGFSVVTKLETQSLPLPQIEAKPSISDAIKTPELFDNATPTPSEIVQPLPENESLPPGETIVSDKDVNLAANIERSPEKIPAIPQTSTETKSSPEANISANFSLPPTASADLSTEPPSAASAETIQSNAIVQPQLETEPSDEEPKNIEAENKTSIPSSTKPENTSLTNETHTPAQPPPDTAKLDESFMAAKLDSASSPNLVLPEVVSSLKETTTSSVSPEVVTPSANTDTISDLPKSVASEEITENSVSPEITAPSAETKPTADLPKSVSPLQEITPNSVSPEVIAPSANTDTISDLPKSVASEEITENSVSPEITAPSAETKPTADLPKSVSPLQEITPNSVSPEVIAPSTDTDTTSDIPKLVASEEITASSASPDISVPLAETKPNTKLPEVVSTEIKPIKPSVIQPLLETEASERSEVVLPDSNQVFESVEESEAIAQPTTIESRGTEELIDPLLSPSKPDINPIPSAAILRRDQPTETTQIETSEIQHPTQETKTASVDSIAADSTVTLKAINSVEPTAIQTKISAGEPESIGIEESTSTPPEISTSVTETSNVTEPIATDKSLLQKEAIDGAIASSSPMISDVVINQTTQASKARNESLSNQSLTPEATVTSEPSTSEAIIQESSDRASIIQPQLETIIPQSSRETVPEGIEQQEILNSNKITSVESPIQKQPVSEIPAAILPESPANPPSDVSVTQPSLPEASPSQNQEISQLPTVIKNISTLKILGQQSSLLTNTSPPEISGETPNIVQKMPEVAANEEILSNADLPIVSVPPIQRDEQSFTTSSIRPSGIDQNSRSSMDSNAKSIISDSWSSIADLLNKTSSNSSSRTSNGDSEPIIVQPLREPGSWDDDDEFSAWFSRASELGKAELSGDFMESGNGSNRSAIASSTPSLNELSEGVENLEQPLQEVRSEASKGEQLSKGKDSQNLELLAREIYNLLRQRLESERERQGDYYSGRLPW